MSTPKTVAIGALNGTSKITLYQAPRGKRFISRLIGFHETSGTGHTVQVFFRRGGVSTEIDYNTLSAHGSYDIEVGLVLDETDAIEAQLSAAGTTVNYLVCGIEEDA